MLLEICLNPDPTNPSQEVIFSRKIRKVTHASTTFNNNPLSHCPIHRHLRFFFFLSAFDIQN